jgi:hypothetical protein
MLTTLHFFFIQHKPEKCFFSQSDLPCHVTYEEEQVGPEKKNNGG